MADNIYTFNKLIEEYTIEIPVIQRDYAQGRDNPKAEEIRKNFIAEIKKCLSGENKELHLNFIYGYKQNKIFIPLDGQQRLTTLFLLHIYLQKGENDNLKKFVYKIRPGSEAFCNALIENIDKVLNQESDKLSEAIIDAPWFFEYWTKDPTVAGMLRMLDEIHKNFKDDDKYKDSLENIKFVFMDLDELKQTDEIYEKMNARGVPLTPFENFKAWLIENVKDKNIKPENWTNLIDIEWTDLFWKYKDEDNMLIDEEFMRYFRNMFQIQYVLTKEPQKSDDNKTLKQEKEDFNKNVSSLATEKDKFTGEYVFQSNEFYSKNGLIEKTILDELFLSINLIDKYIGKIEEEKEFFSKLFFEERINIFRRFIDNKTTYSDKIIFFALFVFLKNINNKELNDELKKKLKSWLRVVRNLAENTNFSVENFTKAIQTINKIDENSLNIYKYLSNDKNTLEGFYEYQMNEEKEKAKLIIENSEWEEIIFEAENHLMFKGQIGFLFRVIENDNVDWLKNNELDKFKKRKKNAEKYFNKDGVSEPYSNDMLLMRAYISKINKWDLLWGIPFGNQKDLWRNELLIDKEAEKKDKVKARKKVELITNLLDINSDSPENEMKKWLEESSSLSDDGNINSNKNIHEELYKTNVLKEAEENSLLKVWESSNCKNFYFLMPYNAKADWKKISLGNIRNEILIELVNENKIELNTEIVDNKFLRRSDVEFVLNDKKYIWAWDDRIFEENYENLKEIIKDNKDTSELKRKIIEIINNL